jgi:hypothetical protein
VIVDYPKNPSSDRLKGSGDVAGQISRSLGGGSNPIEFT